MTIVIAGPTASGKSALTVALAHRLSAAGRPAEVVNADSMLVYRGMDIGTAKPPLAERGGVPHHLIDILDVRDVASVADFQGLARASIADCGARGVVPILVGGSALYLRSIVDDFQFPGTDPQVRARLESDLAAVGAEELHRRLLDQDPAAADRIGPGNGRRLVRALEVVELTGGPYSTQLPPHRSVLPDVVQIGLRLDRPTLDRRIEERLDRMWAAGFVAEVERLSHRGLREGLTASRALGYRQILAQLDGELTEAQARERTRIGTRRFARRQDSWFRRDPRIGWLDATAPDLIDQALRLVQAAASAGSPAPVDPVSG